MDQKFINPINEPEKLVVGGLYEVRFIDHTTKMVYAHQNSSGNYIHDLLRVGDLFCGYGTLGQGKGNSTTEVLVFQSECSRIYYNLDTVFGRRQKFFGSSNCR